MLKIPYRVKALQYWLPYREACFPAVYVLYPAEDQLARGISRGQCYERGHEIAVARGVKSNNLIDVTYIRRPIGTSTITSS